MSQKLSLSAWILIITTAVVYFANFISIPFLSLNLARSNIEYSLIGIIVSAGPLTGVISGSFSGHLSDKLGRYPLLLLFLFGSAIVFFGFFCFNDINFLILLSILLGISAYLVEPIIQAMLSDIHSGELLTRAFAYRYIGINTSASLATLVGTILSINGNNICFALSALIYLVTFIFFLAFRKSFTIRNPKKILLNENISSYYETLSSIFKNKSFVFLMLSFTIIGFSYSHTMSTLSLHLCKILPHTQTALNNNIFAQAFSFLRGKFFAETAFATVILINTLLVVVLQKPSLIFQKFYTRHQISSIGVIAMLPGFIMFAFAQNSILLILLGIVFITIGEIFVMPTVGALIDDLAPKDKRGSYYGIFSLSKIGGACSGLVGGILLQERGILFTWVTIAMLHACSLYFLHESQTRSKNLKS